MKIQDIIEEWQKDCVLDVTRIIAGNANIPLLHSKYSRIYTLEKLMLRRMEADYKKYKLRKEEFYSNPNQEDIDEFGWKVPARGKILKQDMERFIEGDTDIVNKELEIGVQQEKIDLLKSILQSINARTFLYKNIIEEKRFEAGG